MELNYVKGIGNKEKEMVKLKAICHMPLCKATEPLPGSINRAEPNSAPLDLAYVEH